MIAPFGSLPLAAAQRNFLGTPFLQSPPTFGVPQNRLQHGSQLHGLHQRMIQGQFKNHQNEKIHAELDDKGLWDSFHRIGTEMVITKNGR